MRYTTELELRVSTGGSDDDFDQHTDELFDALDDVAGLAEVDMSVNIAKRIVWLHAAADTDEPVTALALVHTAIRTAIHSIGGRTPGWEEALRRAATRISADDAADRSLSQPARR